MTGRLDQWAWGQEPVSATYQLCSQTHLRLLVCNGVQRTSLLASFEGEMTRSVLRLPGLLPGEGECAVR
jgi:hypothetical protein